MEWISWLVIAAMLALLCYTVAWNALALKKKGQPAVDSFFDSLNNFMSSKPASRMGPNDPRGRK